MSTATITLPRWDLSALFKGADDPAIEAAWTRLMEDGQAFAEKYRGRFTDPTLTADSVLRALQEFEAICQSSAKPGSFAQLMFAADTSNPNVGAFMQAQMEEETKLSVLLMFFELEVQAIPDDNFARIIADDKLRDYRFYLERLRVFKPFQLSEKEEVLLAEFGNTGSSAFQRLFAELTSNHSFRLINPEGTEVQATLEEVITQLRDSNRLARQAAADALTDGLEAMQRTLGFIYNTLLQDKATEDRVRGYTFAEQSRHMANSLEPATVDLVVDKCHANYGLVHRFYRIKREILGLAELTHIDRYAPLLSTKEKVTWEQAKEITLSSFAKFSPVMRERAEEFFDRNWIDAEVRPGKRGGAFCAYITPDTHPFVLMSFLGELNDVMTLAHELGHGVHSSLSRGQSYFNFHGTLPLAELASTFGEMLVFERLVADATPMDRLALYAEKIEGMFGSIFRQAALYSFERSCHKARREEGELSWDRFGQLWQAALQPMFGESLTLGDQHKCWWSYVSHFINVPFYVYAYSFGELLATNLFQMSKTGGPEFPERYLDLLRLGGSRSPQDLMKTVGVDLNSGVFWDQGFATLTRMIEEFEAQWSVIGPTFTSLNQ